MTVTTNPKGNPKSCLIKSSSKQKDIRTILKSFKQDEATGPYQVSGRVLKEFSAKVAAPIVPFLLILLPKGWLPSPINKIASVIPVPKDSRADPTNIDRFPC